MAESFCKGGCKNSLKSISEIPKYTAIDLFLHHSFEYFVLYSEVPEVLEMPVLKGEDESALICLLFQERKLLKFSDSWRR